MRNFLVLLSLLLAAPACDPSDDDNDATPRDESPCDAEDPPPEAHCDLVVCEAGAPCYVDADCGDAMRCVVVTGHPMCAVPCSDNGPCIEYKANGTCDDYLGVCALEGSVTGVCE